jgi:hypothetical protein
MPEVSVFVCWIDELVQVEVQEDDGGTRNETMLVRLNDVIRSLHERPLRTRREIR